MDKKTLFQIQSSQSKLVKYKESLNVLLESKKNVENKAKETNPDRSRIIELQAKQSNLEAQIKLFKKDISLNVNNNETANKNLQLLENILSDKLKTEDDILVDELNRIDEDIINAKSLYEESINTANIDMIELCQQIELLKTDIEIQNNIIKQIQLESHSSRKNLLKDLHNKKTEKIITEQHINSFKNNEENFNNQIQSLDDINNQLVQFKKMIIDDEYNIDYDKEKTLYYYNEFNIDIQLNINDKIAKIDNMINENKMKIQFLNNKLKKNIKSSEIKIKEILDKYNTIDRNKIIRYKTKIKIEKGNQSDLENMLEDLVNKYTNFDNIIIKTINDDFEYKNNELEIDKTRANNRLSIMKIRIMEDYEKDKLRYNDIINNCKSNIENIHNNFNNINLELKNVKQLIIKEDEFTNELDKINAEILKYQNIITQTENDIDKLSNI